MSFMNTKELQAIGFESIGINVKLSRKASIYNAENIKLGDNTRIDDFAVLSAGEGGIEVGRNVHIAVYSSLIGKGKIRLGDFVNISSRVSIYSSSDDYSGCFMTNPTVDEKYTNIDCSPVSIESHVIIGSGSVVLPGVHLAQGVAVGALSLIDKSFSSFVIVGGVPAKKIKNREKVLLDRENQLRASED